MPKISERTKHCIAQTIGLPYNEITRLDFDDEIAYVERKTGKHITFFKKGNSKRMSRGNPLIATGRIRTMEDIDKKIKKIK